MQEYPSSPKVSSPPSPIRWRPDRETTDTPFQVLNIRRVRQGKEPHFVRVHVVVGSVLINNVLSSAVGTAWPMRHGDPLVQILDEPLRRRIEQALREAARLENTVEVPA